MDVWGGLIHIVNFFGPAVGLALLVPTVSRLFWWRELKSVPWLLQCKRVGLVCAGVSLVGYVLLGRDGAMWTYMVLVLASATTVWWTGLR
jgi:hypothetical protein